MPQKGELAQLRQFFPKIAPITGFIDVILHLAFKKLRFIPIPA